MKAIFLPSIVEAKKIFPEVVFKNWKYGILQGDFRGLSVFITGVSKTPTVFNTSVILSEVPVTEAYLTGVCGAYRSSGLAVGDVVTVGKDFFADEGLLDGGEFKSLDQMGFWFLEKRYTEFSVLEGLTVADSATVSFLDGEGRISEILQKSTGAKVENMEGASFAYVCNMLKVKCFQIRAVSNYCGVRKDQQWDFNQAVRNLKSFFETFY